jgi:hypothetical protein
VSTDPSEDFLDVMQGFWDEDLKADTSSDYSLERIVMRNDFTVAERPYEDFGGSVGSFVTPQVAALVKLSSGQIGRRNRGRLYWPGVVSELGVSLQGDMGDTLYSDLSDTVLALATAIVAGDAEPVIIHSTEGEPTPVTNLSLARKVATQRRRLRG